MAEIPEDVIVKILVLFPVAALLRFRCVSKRWRDIIDSPYFVRSHLNLSNNEKAHSLMIFCEKTWPYYIEFDSIRNDSPPPILKELTIKPWYGDVCKSFGVVGACNGLVCLYTTHCVVVLWNPLIGKHFQFPLPQQLNKFYLWCWGFGYDSDSDDYKVVCIELISENDGSRFVVWVYSLNSGLWKTIGDFPNSLLRVQEEDWPSQLLCKGENGVFGNGKLHWIVCSESIVAIDLGNLEYRMLPQPDFRDADGDTLFDLGILDGCLCAISINFYSRDFDLWVMKEYGVKESWTKVVTCAAYTAELKPLAHSENGSELLFLTRYNVIRRYGFETGSFKEMIHYWSSSNLGKPLIYIPSLVCPLPKW